MRMKNLGLGILVAFVAIIGFYAYQSSQQVTALQTELAAKEAALTMIEGEKAALTEQVTGLQAQVDQLSAAAEAEVEIETTPAPVLVEPAVEAPVVDAPAEAPPVAATPAATEAPAEAPTPAATEAPTKAPTPAPEAPATNP